MNLRPPDSENVEEWLEDLYKFLQYPIFGNMEVENENVFISSLDIICNNNSVICYNNEVVVL